MQCFTVMRSMKNAQKNQKCLMREKQSVSLSETSQVTQTTGDHQTLMSWVLKPKLFSVLTMPFALILENNCRKGVRV
ncbi:hypothetical protein BGLY_3321 [Bacillus glycinifermentans]|nr:hypothetical protein BGLY_3321 [Bacillus glycinifermentans]